jgi:hypothetical protein
MCEAVLLCFVVLASSAPATAGFKQQGAKLVGSGGASLDAQGVSVAASADGNTVIVGGSADDYSAGAVWMFVRNGGEWSQQGPKLVGTGAVGKASQGGAVAISADGNTAIVGGSSDDDVVGAVWVFTRSDSGIGEWTQQGPKLVGAGAVGNARQGAAVAISADGNTAIVGGPDDDTYDGAAWVFTRSNGLWSQQGPKLVGTGVQGIGRQGWAVALSGDGNTAVVGGYNDNNALGAAWVFTRNGDVWTQQGPKLVGIGAEHSQAMQGYAVATSRDGNTLVIGAPGDRPSHLNDAGASWVFTRSGEVWSQQGNKIVGTGATGSARLGTSVAVSADGNTAIVGGYVDNNSLGATWVFSRSGGVWSQQGPKLVGTGAVGNSFQGEAAAISADGNLAVVGAHNDAYGKGAAWVFARSDSSSLATHDINGDHRSDLVWRNLTTGDTAIWLMNGPSIASSGSLGPVSPQWSIVGQRDFNGDGRYDLLWRDSTTGTVAIWFLNGTTFTSAANLGAVPFSIWTIVGTCDVNGDGNGDLIWRGETGVVAVWLLDGGAVASSASFGTVGTNWQIVGCADFEGDGKADLLWRDSSTGAVAIWFLNGATVTLTANLGAVSIVSWPPAGMQTGDFNGDGRADILWRSDTGVLATWLMNGATLSSSATLGTVPLNWTVTETGDFDGDGTSDLLWREATGLTAMWFLNGTTVWSTATLGSVDTSWVIQNLNAN